MTKRGCGPMTLLMGTFALAPGCGESDAPAEEPVREFTIEQSCAETDADLCYDYGASEDVSECTQFGGTLLQSVCPTEARVGSCHSANEDRIVRYYEGDTEGSGWTTETARDNCNIGPFVED